MSNQSYFPNSESAQIVWLTNYRSKIGIHGPVCGIAPDEVAATQKDLDLYIWVLQVWHPAMQRAAREATLIKQQLIGGGGTEPVILPAPPVFPDRPEPRPPGLQKRLFSQIVRIKAAAGYTDAIGVDLGIVNTSTPTEHPVPDVSAGVELGSDGPRVRLDFNKYGHDGIWIESRINGGDWAFLAIDTVKPYFDERPLAPGNVHETREYRVRWWDKSAAHGEWSGVVRVVLGV